MINEKGEHGKNQGLSVEELRRAANKPDEKQGSNAPAKQGSERQGSAQVQKPAATGAVAAEEAGRVRPQEQKGAQNPNIGSQAPRSR